jgi:hypothetical protein
MAARPTRSTEHAFLPADPPDCPTAIHPYLDGIRPTVLPCGTVDQAVTGGTASPCIRIGITRTVREHSGGLARKLSCSFQVPLGHGLDSVRVAGWWHSA